MLQATQKKPQNNQTQDPNRAPQGQQAPSIVLPFGRASNENIQSGNLDRSVGVLTANSTDLGVTNIPAYGFLRFLYILVEATGGAAGLNNAVAKEDAPWSILRDIAITEPNGSPIAQFNTGYDLFLANKYGGYLYQEAGDPRSFPAFSAIATSGNFKFLLRIPLELNGRDGVGALANQDSAGEFKLRMKVGAFGDIYSTAPDTKPAVRVRTWMGSWDQPEPTSNGMAQQTEPPGHGTTGFWSIQSGITINAGENTITLNRKGNYLRQMILVLRRAGTSRANGESDYPTELRFERDAFPGYYLNFDVWKQMMYERTAYDNTADTKRGPENGVRFIDFMHEFNGSLGYELRDGWQVTRSSTRLELKGSFANAGTMDILFNDVAVAQGVWI